MVVFLGDLVLPPEPIRRYIFDWEVTGLIAFADHWQTLLGAAIAIPLAAFAIIVPIVHESARIRRRAYALRASLPIRLSEVTHYAMEALGAVAACRTSGGVSKPALTAFEPPDLPPTLVDGLERTIEALTKRSVNRRLANIIEQIQVLKVRMEGLSNDRDKFWIDAVLIQAATVYAQAASLFEYARREKPSTVRRLTWENVLNAFNLAKMFGPRYDETRATIARYDNSGMDPERENSWRRARINKMWRGLKARFVLPKFRRRDEEVLAEIMRDGDDA